MDSLAKWLLKTAFFLGLFGGVLLALKRYHPAGRLPGDLTVRYRDRAERLYIPLGTIGIGALLLTAYLNLFERDRGVDS
jgi:hypothetical protein